ncbi:hypothetical protein F5051DRAFT_341891, partial [Lentinula edodes]
FKNDDNKPLSGDSRLYRILISESAYLIWKLRCERVIGGKAPLTEKEIIRRWRKTLENRIQLDQILSTRKFNGKPLSKKTVENTWKEVVTDQDIFSQTCMVGAGVLVGKHVGCG